MFKKLVTGLIISAALSASANAMVVYSNGFNSASDLDDFVDVSNSDGSFAISGDAFGLAPQEGAGYLAFTGNSNEVEDPYYGGLYLDITEFLMPGHTYELSYYWGGRGQVSPNAEVEVGITTGAFGSGSVLSNSFATNSKAVGIWTLFTTSFVAPESELGLTYLDLSEISSNSQNVGPALDSLSLTRTSVPAPASLALLGLGLLGLSSLGRTKR